ncbi:hypothetical protein VTP01DRAFT_8552 [Rhizomucor pusillus]|uniref:uncharacterized protein n=1 Tax=Rhizomucor pusillus TaxID=4840 RepID=UPI0037435DCA
MTTSLPEYWSSIRDFDITAYDTAYITKYPSATKQIAHTACQQDIRTLKRLHQSDVSWRKLLKFAKKKLKNCHRDYANVKLWSEEREELARIGLEKSKQSIKQHTAVDKYLTAAIEEKTESLKRPHGEGSSDDSDTNVSSSEYYKRARTRYKYGQESNVLSNIMDDSARWLWNSLDITGILMEYRRAAVSLNKKKEGGMSDLRILYLSHIIYFSADYKQSLTKEFLTVQEHDAFMQEVKEMVQSGEAYSLRTLKLFTSSCLQTALKKDQSDLAMFADILHRILLKKYKGSLEDSFLKDRFADIVDVIFGEERKLEHNWAKKTMPIFQKIPKDIKVDYQVVSISPKQRSITLLTLEAKSPSEKNRTCNGYNDFLKLGKEMKCICDNLVSLSVREPVVTGILVKGFECRLYKLSLRHEAIYEMVEIGSFRLPDSLLEVESLPGAVEEIMMLKESAIKIKTFVNLILNEKIECSEPVYSLRFIYFSSSSFDAILQSKWLNFVRLPNFRTPWLKFKRIPTSVELPKIKFHSVAPGILARAATYSEYPLASAYIKLV